MLVDYYQSLLYTRRFRKDIKPMQEVKETVTLNPKGKHNQTRFLVVAMGTEEIADIIGLKETRIERKPKDRGHDSSDDEDDEWFHFNSRCCVSSTY